MQYFAWQLVTALLRVLPQRVSYGVAGLVGSAAFVVWPRGRRATIRNFRRVLPAEGGRRQRQVARRSLANYCRYLVEFIRFPTMTREELASHAEISDETLADLRAAFDDGNGVLIVCMHFGNWDLGAGAAAANGIPLAVVAESFSDERLDEKVVGARERAGMTVLKMEKVTPSLFRTLKQNGMVALLIDRPVPGDGVAVEFFGETVEVPAGPARIAIRTGARVVPMAFGRRFRSKPGVRTVADYSIRFEPTDDNEADVQALTQAIMTAHERFIAAHPDQWYMFREMWSERPA